MFIVYLVWATDSWQLCRYRSWQIVLGYFIECIDILMYEYLAATGTIAGR